MRVLVLSSLWPPAVLGGAEIYAARLASELHERGHDVAAVTAGVDGDHVIASTKAWPYRLDQFVGQPRWKRVAFHARDVYDPTAARVVRRAIDSFDPDVVHSHSVAGLSTAVLTAPSVAGVAHVHHVHDYWLLCQRSSFTRRDGTECEQRCAGCVTIRTARSALLRRHGPDAVISPSRYVAEVHEKVPWARGRVRVLHLPADVAVPDGQVRAVHDPITFGYIGQVSVVKGVRTLLAAFSRVAPSGAQLLVAGRGALDDEVTGEGVTALGWVDGARRDDFWAAIDCLVVPSEWAEPGGTVAVEARARRLPVIAANAGGMVEAVEDASLPLRFEPGDVNGLASSLQRFVDDPTRYRPHPASTWPSWAEHVTAVEAIYADVLDT